MNNQPKKIELRRRTSTVKKALIEAGAEGMQMPELLALVSVDEPNLTRNTLAVWIAEHQRQAQAVRDGRNAEGYIWYHRGAHPSASTPTPLVRSTPTQLAPRYNRVIIFTLPTLPRITPLRVYAVGVTLFAVTLTALEVL
jgi:hypothetical protein